MIFVTVGTHEQQFNRLVEEVDRLAGEGLNADVFIQIGFSTYKPKHCKYRKMISNKEMNRYYRDADIIITHGGPSSFITALKYGKVPIVVPRQRRYGEHVNDHQMRFCRLFEQRRKDILVVEDVSTLGEKIENYSKITKDMSSQVEFNNKQFCKKLEREIGSLFE
ncbi:MAG: PssE/Cps14G family polysaccharide biosynthesis glycosyltransferase [Candidatus Saccharibacteria bacterium]|nr:PssE/Cps14G family polysaccharide biosynthesis glycosyltransferase [Candidatus Saccharibacteria bacterium]